MRHAWLSATLFLATALPLAGAPPGAAPANPALHPLPTPTPRGVQPIGAAGSALPNGAAGSAVPKAAGLPGQAHQTVGASVRTVLNTPQHSPDHLDFGEVWNGQFSMRTFYLTTTAAGYLRAEIPNGPFRVVEIRELGPPKPGSSKNNPGGLQPMISQETKGKVSFPDNQPGPWTYGAAAGDQVLIHVVFKPKFDLGSMMAGPKQATMKVTGPGPMGGWALSIPMHGAFNGLRIGAVFTVDDKEVMAVQGTPSVNVAARLTGTDTVLNGVVSGKNPPPGVQVSQVPVTVNPSQTVAFTVPVTISWGALNPDGQARSVELLFQAGAQSASTAFSLIPVPATFSSGGQRHDCGIGWLGWAAIFYPSGKLLYSLSGNNQDFINNRDVIGIASIAGRPVAWGILHLPFDASGRTKTDYHQWDSTRVNVDFDARFRADDYLAAVHGPVTFTCNLVGSNFNPPF